MLRSPDCSVIRLDRNRHGGGIGIHVENIVMVNTLLYKPSVLEFMLHVVSLCNSTSKLYIGLLYHPPSHLHLFLKPYIFTYLKLMSTSFLIR